MPCKRYPKFDPDTAVSILEIDPEEATFPEGIATFDNVPQKKVLKAYRDSGMKEYPRAKHTKKAPSIQKVVNIPYDNALFSGYVIPCTEKKEEGTLAVEVACIPDKEIPYGKDVFKKYNHKWREPMGNKRVGYDWYTCYGWSNQGWA